MPSTGFKHLDLEWERFDETWLGLAAVASNLAILVVEGVDKDAKQPAPLLEQVAHLFRRLFQVPLSLIRPGQTVAGLVEPLAPVEAELEGSDAVVAQQLPCSFHAIGVTVMLASTCWSNQTAR